MKIGIMLGEYEPHAGGAFTLIDKIKKQIIEASQNENTYVFLFSDKNSPESLTINSFQYINLKRQSIPKWRKIVKKILGKKEPSKTIDTVAEQHNIDLIWFVFPTSMRLSIPYIYTIWDLGHRSVPFFPEVSRTGWSWDERETCYRTMVFKATFILTGNEAGKREILENYSVSPEKIKIVPFPVADFCFGNEKKPNINLPVAYYFYPAQFWPHKNHIRILQALKILREEFKINCSVVFTGSDKGNKQYILDKIKEFELEDSVVFPGFVSDEELKYLYRHAKAMIFASLMGPNNMPPIEATVLSCPVIITDLTGHKEQLGNSAIYFDGSNAHDLAEKILLFDANTSLRDDIKEKQKLLSEVFVKENYFEKVNKIIDELNPYRDCWETQYSNH